MACRRPLLKLLKLLNSPLPHTEKLLCGAGRRFAYRQVDVSLSTCPYHPLGGEPWGVYRASGN